MKICSFLPSGTEILFALGLDDSVAGVTFECDYPPQARSKPVVVYSKLPPGLTQGEIDREVKSHSGRHESLYLLNAEKLLQIEPDLIVTQDLCHVCAASPDDVGAVLAKLRHQPEILALTPRTVSDVLNDIVIVGEATGQIRHAQDLVCALKTRIDAVATAKPQANPRVLCLEWLDPPFVGGHWLPEMVSIAGGHDVLGRSGLPSFEVDWPTIVASDPDIILVMPCGYHTEEVEQELRKAKFPGEWRGLRAVQNGNVYAMDASSRFSRPGPRIVEGIEVMAQIFRQHSLANAKLKKTAKPDSDGARLNKMSR